MANIAGRSLLPYDHFKGNSRAAVTLLEYGDFECHRCVAAFHTLDYALHWLDDCVCFVFRHCPNTGRHSHAFSAAQAAEAAGSQGKFWEMHDCLFSHTRELDDQNLIAYADRLGLSLELFKREMLENTHAAKVNDDCVAAVQAGVIETPAFFINGVRYKGEWDLDGLLEAIEDVGVSVTEENEELLKQN